MASWIQKRAHKITLSRRSLQPPDHLSG